jgi:hypothetical protein
MDRPIWVRLLAVLERNPESTTVTLNRASAEEMLHEIKRLQDGGCARNQGLTQYCAEAAEKDVEITRLKAEVQWHKDNSARRGTAQATLIREITRLKAEVERLGRDYNTARDAHDSMLLENDRLRKALESWDYAVRVNLTPSQEQPK